MPERAAEMMKLLFNTSEPATTPRTGLRCRRLAQDSFSMGDGTDRAGLTQ